MMKTNFCLPNNITAQQFLDEYWQKKPLLIKNGLPDLIEMFEPDDILTLALNEDVSARLITQNNQQWSLKNSPFNSQDFSSLPKYWTILIQNMEQWSIELANLWHAFDFIPQWQRDDIMVSYAPKGGSVGKHYDDYDVFLAQGYGQRRWQLGKFCDEQTSFITGQPIRIFDDLGDIIFDEVLNPGDVLYVPPRLAHFGVAQNDCLTFSFGFRRPSMLQLLDNIANISTDNDSLSKPLFVNQPLHEVAKLDKTTILEFKQKLIDYLNSSQGEYLIQQALCETVSKRQYDIFFSEEPACPDFVLNSLKNGATIIQDLASRIVYTTNPLQVFVNGDRLSNEDFSEKSLQLLIKIANGQTISFTEIQDYQVDIDTICDWLDNAWVILQE